MGFELTTYSLLCECFLNSATCPGPFRRFSTCVWQNALINTVKCLIVCNLYFFLRLYNFLKGI